MILKLCKNFEDLFMQKMVSHENIRYKKRESIVLKPKNIELKCLS